MKKIIGLAVVFSLFCCVNIFAEDKTQNNEEDLNKKEIEQAQKYVQQMTSFAETFMNSFKNFVSQDENIVDSIICKNKDKFSKIEKQIYQKYPEYEGNINFISNGVFIKNNNNLEENKIANNSVINIIKINDK